MARTLRNVRLGSPTARAELKPSGKPYFVELEPGAHIGYRKPVKGAGKWVLRTYEGNGVYRVETIGTADDLTNVRDADGVTLLSWKQVQDVARETMEHRVKHAATAAARAYTVSVAMAEYLDWYAAARKSAVDAKHRVDAHILPALGDRPVSELTADELRGWLHGLAKIPARVRSKAGKAQRFKAADLEGDEEVKRKRRASANRTLTILKAALNRAWREKKVENDDAWRRVEPFRAADAARVRYLSVDEARRLINASDQEFRPLVEAALATGCRYGELCRMTVADFNVDTGTVAVRISKSGKPRHVVLTEEGVDIFRRLTRGRLGHELMFISNARIAWASQQAREMAERTGKPVEVDEDGSWRASQQARPIAEASKRASISPPVNFHCLRHTWASHAVMNGVPLLVVAKNLGHADTRMVEKHYGHLAPSYIADAIRAGAPRFGTAALEGIVDFKARY